MMNKRSPKSAGGEAESKVPADLRTALAAAPLAQAKWDDLTPVARRDFISWIDTAKQAETRRRRVERACDMLVAGKRRPCCFAVVPMDFYKALGARAKAKTQWGDLTSMERRDLIDWIDAAKAKEMRKGRVEQACVALAAGKRRV